MGIATRPVWLGHRCVRVWLAAASASFAACGGGGSVVPVETPTPTPAPDTYDVKAHGLPRFIGKDYIDLDRIRMITRFRSGIGHDYSDDFEKCRTMKHYYMPFGGQPGEEHSFSWTEVGIYSPVRGTVTQNVEEWAGTQVWIRSQTYPGITVIIAHIALARTLNVGDEVAEGERLGHHIGDQTMSDIMVGIKTPEGWKLVSYFDVMTESLFELYKDRGVSSRSVMMISKEERDADPLTCDGETYVGGSGHIENWVELS
jgi:hypothetical protein